MSENEIKSSMLADPEVLDRIFKLLRDRKNDPRALPTDIGYGEFREAIEDALRAICRLIQDDASGSIWHAQMAARAKTAAALAEIIRRLKTTGYHEDAELESDPGGAVGEFVEVLSEAEASVDEAEDPLNSAFHAIEGGLWELEANLKAEAAERAVMTPEEVAAAGERQRRRAEEIARLRERFNPRS